MAEWQVEMLQECDILFSSRKFFTVPCDMSLARKANMHLLLPLPHTHVHGQQDADDEAPAPQVHSRQCWEVSDPIKTT